MKNPLANGVIYARVSTTRQAEKGLSIPGQIERCKTKLADEGYFVEKVYQEAESASESADHRPQFQEMVAYCRAAEVKALCVYDTSRFSRRREDAVVYKNILRKSGVKILYVNHDIGESEDDRFIEGLFELLDERTARVQGKLAARGMADNAKAGFFNGGQAPFGYVWTHVSHHGSRKLTLEIDPIRAQTVRQVFRWALEGLGCISITRLLNDRGITTVKGARWNSNKIDNMLRNVRYLGHNVAKINGKREIIEGTHQPIIDQDTWDQVQNLRKNRSPRKRGQRIVPNTVVKFSRVLYCAKCGSAIVSTTGRSRSGKTYFYYECSEARKKGENHGRYRALEMDRFLMDTLMEHVFVEENLKRAADALLKFTEDMTREAEEERETLRREMQRLEEKIQRLYEILEDPGSAFELADLAPRLKTLKTSKMRLQDQAKCIAMPSIPTITDPMRARAIEEIRHTINEATTEQLVAFLRNFDLKILIKPGQLSFEANPALFLSEALKVFIDKNIWRARKDSNLRPLAPEANALSS